MRYTFADLVAAAQAIEAVDRLRADLAEFAAGLDADGDGVVDFLDIATGDAFDVSPDEAIDYFRRKGLRATFSYADMVGQANDAAFTIAKMMDVDLLGQVRKSLDEAMANGTAFGEWKKGIEPMLKAAGWWGQTDMPDPQTGAVTRAQLGSAWRLETIFRTNMQSAYAAGQWQQIQAQAELAPFLMYDAVDDFRTRPLHASWDSKVLPVTSPWWRTHYPPNGYNCRCGVIQLDADQLRDMGITPTAIPPDDGSYNWTNPRTGRVERVPNGIDPGFDRVPSASFTDQLQQIMAEKVKTLPPDMREAIAPVVRREFDGRTTAGRWHIASFDNAPDWLRDVVVARQAVDVEFKASTAHAWLGQLIDMDGKKIDTGNGQETWRHEFGHILDNRLATSALYRSSQPDFQHAQHMDALGLVSASGNGRKSKANAARRQEVLDAYEAARTAVIDAERTTRPELLRDMATAAGLDFDGFLSVVRDSTLILDGTDDLQDLGRAVRIARMIEAVRLGDGEGFLRWASFKDVVEDASRARSYDTEAIKTVGRSWRKDGALAGLSDLVGSATRNKAAGYSSGFPGHSDSYYKKASFYAPTESFANLTALAGHPNPYWWQLVQRFAPSMAALYRQIIEGET